MALTPTTNQPPAVSPDSTAAVTPAASAATAAGTARASITPTAIANATPRPAARLAGPGVKTEPATVTRIVDGDTIDVAIAGTDERVRLILIDTPEVFGRAECFGREASAFAAQLMPVGSTVHLERDVSETDRFDRLLRYVWLPDGRMANEVLVAEGYAALATFPPDVRHVDRLRAAQTAARESGRGLWTACAIAASTPAPAGTPAATAVPAGSPPGLPVGSRTGVPVLYDPIRPDRDCGDFASWAQAQDFFEAAGGPTRDPHWLDRDGDGIACESLPGHP